MKESELKAATFSVWSRTAGLHLAKAKAEGKEAALIGGGENSRAREKRNRRE